jgi:outer membrane protein TolC/AcrR family transcriptional regulator
MIEECMAPQGNMNAKGARDAESPASAKRARDAEGHESAERDGSTPVGGAGQGREGRRREEILRAARDEFTRFGYAGTSMRRIAEATGVTKAALYYHFPDKETLFRVATEEAVRRRRDRILARIEGIEGPCMRLRELVHAYLDQFLEDRALSRRLYALLFLPNDKESWVARMCSDFGQPMEDALAACADTGCLDKTRVEEVKVLLMGGIEYLGVLWLLDPNAPAPTRDMGDRLIAQIVPAVLDDPADPCKGGAGALRPQRPQRPRSPRRTLRTAVLVVLFPLAACVGGALGDNTGAVSTTASGAAAVVEAIPGAVPTDLNACLSEALQNNAALQAERMRRGELKGLKYQALAIGLPTVDATGMWNRGRDPSFAFSSVFGGSGGSDSAAAYPPEYPDWFVNWLSNLSFIPDAQDIAAQTYWRTSLNAHWQLNLALVFNAVGAAGLGILQEELVIADAEHRTEEEVMRAYYGVIKAGEQIEALDASLAQRHEFLDVTRRRFLLGLSTPLDTLRAAVSLANLLPQRSSAAQALRDAGGALNTAMGREPLTPIAVFGRLPVESDRVDSGLTERMVERRPDLRALDLTAQIQRKNRGAKKAELRPSLSADASYGYVTTELDQLTDTGHDYWSASLSLKIPLFDGLQTHGLVQEVEAGIRRLEYQYDQARRQARLEVLSLHGSLEAAREILKAARLNLEASEQALEQVNLRYELGKAEYLEVLDMQAAWLVARGNYINAENDVLTLTASLKRALGFSPQRPLADVVAALEQEARIAPAAPER